MAVAKPVHEDIEATLRKEIDDGCVVPHERFLSESKLSQRFGVNVATVRKAVDRMVADGLLYKIPSSGTFIAPRRKNRMILIVIPAQECSLISFCAVEDFVDTPYWFQEVPASEYLRHVDDIELIYPELVGVIFYQDKPVVSNTFGTLEEKGIPFIMYGSSNLRPVLKNRASLLYSEQMVVQTAMEYLQHAGCRRIGMVYSTLWATKVERHRKYVQWHESNGIEWEADWVFHAQFNQVEHRPEIHQQLVESLRSGPLSQADGLFCSGDIESVIVLQAALAAGVRIPEDLKIIGVNNDPICECVVPQLTSIEIPKQQDSLRVAKALIAMVEREAQCPELISAIRVVKRQSA